jgi:hypothetical protein
VARARAASEGRKVAFLPGEAASLENGNEDPGSFRVTSRYVVATARRDG